jgi:hypothetical protein
VLGQQVTLASLSEVTTRYRRGDVEALCREAMIALAGPAAEVRHGCYTDE